MAIALALITKEVYSSLFIGILVGGLFFSGFSFEGTITHIFQDGLISVLSDSWNVGILVFLVILGTMVAVFADSGSELMIISISACMAGAVCGDHCSPISDTTIMASAGGQCDHVNHVSTQLPYAISVAVISFITYVLAGFVRSPWICLPVGMILITGLVILMKNRMQEEENT